MKRPSPTRPEDQGPKHVGAVRTCLVGRDEHPRDDLLRLVVGPDGEVVPDPKATLPGRGAWILPDQERLRQLVRRKGVVESALGVNVDTAALVAEIRASIARSALDGLSIAAAAGALIGGQERLSEALLSGKVDLVVVASDAAERTLERLETAGEEAEFISSPWTSEQLGARVGRGALAAVGLTTVGSTRSARRWLRRLVAAG